MLTTESIWWQTLGSTERSQLSESDPLPRTAEIAIVGDGMIGQ